MSVTLGDPVVCCTRLEPPNSKGGYSSLPLFYVLSSTWTSLLLFALFPLIAGIHSSSNVYQPVFHSHILSLRLNCSVFMKYDNILKVRRCNCGPSQIENGHQSLARFKSPNFISLLLHLDRINTSVFGRVLPFLWCDSLLSAFPCTLNSSFYFTLVAVRRTVHSEYFKFVLDFNFVWFLSFSSTSLTVLFFLSLCLSSHGISYFSYLAEIHFKFSTLNH
jgi:hypothetical protein